MTQPKKVASRFLSYALTHTSCTCRSRDRTHSVPCGNEVFVGNCSFFFVWRKNKTNVQPLKGSSWWVCINTKHN